MNPWVARSIELANEHDYLDRLSEVYPVSRNPPRQIDQAMWNRVVDAVTADNDNKLLNALLDLDLFPIKHPFVAYMKRDRGSVTRNPIIVQQIASELREYGTEQLWRMCSAPKETNRQIGPMFGRWVESTALRGALRCKSIDEFRNGHGNRYLIGSDALKKECVRQEFGHSLKKGPDLLAIWNRRYVIGEAKLITDFGGHQQTQFNDALDLLGVGIDAVRVAILDGIIYIRNGNAQMQTMVRETELHIMSALLLREFLDAI